MLNKPEQINNAELVGLPDRVSLEKKKLIKILTFCPAFTDLLVLQLANQHSARASKEWELYSCHLTLGPGYGTHYWEDHHMLEHAGAKRNANTL